MRQLFISPIEGMDGATLWVVGDSPRGVSGLAFTDYNKAVDYYNRERIKDIGYQFIADSIDASGH
jgi:hypothetical protein